MCHPKGTAKLSQINGKTSTPPKGSGYAPALELGFLKQGATFSIIVRYFLPVEEPIVFKIKPTSKFP